MAPRHDKAEAVFGWALAIIQKRAERMASWREVKRRPWLLFNWGLAILIILLTGLAALLALICCDTQHDSSRSAWFDDR